ncbi:MAG TPA: PatB family C-S lyase [Aggregatilineaceae bacterium]|nr:PatB family C-S lyase [Aggregatilineaceae bacterium]
MKTYDFDKLVEVRTPDSVKWNLYGKDVLPMWVADMDFPTAEPIIQALHDRIDQGILGYPLIAPELPQIICDRMKRLYDWDVQAEDVVFLPGLEFGLNLACRLVGNAGDSVLVQTPIYPPFLAAPPSAGKFLQKVDLVCTEQADGVLHYTIDYEALEAAMSSQAALLLFCNPHNPSGRVFTRDEIAQVAEICLRHHVLICADEIHSDLVYEGHIHTPLASLSEEISQSTLTFLAPSKTYNIAGLRCSIAIIQNHDLRKKFEEAIAYSHAPLNVLGLVATAAAYQLGDEWLSQLRVYLQQNRDYLLTYVSQNLPEMKMTNPEGTYLAWLDCRALNLTPSAYKFFLTNAHVALGNSSLFGAGDDFVRLNFACPRSRLTEGLDKLREAVESR